MNFEEKKERAEQHALKVKQKQEISEIKHKNDVKASLSFSKLAFIFMMGNCMIVEIYALVTMIIFADLSPLTTLIVAVIGECISLIAYMVKSTHENTAGGIIYESAMAKLKNELDNDDAVG